MPLNESQRRAWAALKLGPLWVSRTHSLALADPATQEAMPDEPASGRALVGAQASHPQPHGPEAAQPAAEAASGRPRSARSDALANSLGADTAQGVPPLPAPDRALQIAALDWADLRRAVAACTTCGLCRTRSRTVFGSGPQQAPWMLVGEAPGAEEDARGEPFVGQAGQLLDAMLAAIGVKRAEEVFIANVLKCRPPRNRDPEPPEVAACEPFLKRQIELVAPCVIVVLGRFAAQSLLGTDASIGSLRGRVHRIESAGKGVPVIVTYHPAYLLRNLTDKAKAWQDLVLARQTMENLARSAPQAP
jgi:uracil-DNA glycosylase